MARAATASGGEKSLNLDVALRVEKILKPFNFPVILTRPG